MYLYNLCMKAVWTTFGCWEDVAAAALIPLPVVPFCIGVASPWLPLLRGPAVSISGLLCPGGPITADAVGVMSIGSSWVDSTGFVEDGSIGMFL